MDNRDAVARLPGVVAAPLVLTLFVKVLVLAGQLGREWAVFGAGAVCVYLLLSSQLAPRLASQYSQYREDYQLEALMAARAAAVRCRNTHLLWKNAVQGSVLVAAGDGGRGLQGREQGGGQQEVFRC